METLPETLKEAVRTFVIAATIRALRGDGNEHATMMVNVSPYKQPQKSAARQIDEYLRELKDALKSYGLVPSAQALKCSTDLQFLYGTWASEYKKICEFEWDEVQRALYDSAKTIRVVSINTDSQDRLEYEMYTEHVIAVGGYRLSRGLTLEGLIVSYYSRNAKAYDALMQMARWFGYRPGYEDLCRIWMSEQAAGWYAFVTDATVNLFDELRNMRQIQRTPKNYGLKIQQSPDSLIVTARNKMGTGMKLNAPTDLNNGFVETIAFDRRPEAIGENGRVVERLLNSIKSFEEDKERHLFRGVPVDSILEFISSYTNDDAASPKSQNIPIRNYIDDRLLDGELVEWDVYVASGEGDPSVRLADYIEVKPEIRYPGKSTSSSCLVVGEKHRLASRGVEKEGLSDAQREAAIEDFLKEHQDKEKKNTSDRYFRLHRTYPLLVIHPVLLKYNSQKKEEYCDKVPPAQGWGNWDHEEFAYGWSISFPRTEKQTKPVTYIFNQVAVDRIREEFKEDSDDDYNDN